MTLEPVDIETIANSLVPSFNSQYDNNEEFSIFTTLRYDPLIYSDNSVPLLDAIDENPLNASLFFLFNYHLEKLQRSGEFFSFKNINGLTESVLLRHLTNALQSKDRLTPHRIRITINREGEVDLTIGQISIDDPIITVFPKPNAPIPPVDWSSNELQKNDNESPITIQSSSLSVATIPYTLPYVVYVYPEFITPIPQTSFKTTIRDLHNKARAYFSIPAPGHPPKGKYTNTQDVLLKTGTKSNTSYLETSICSVFFHRLLTHPTNGSQSWAWVTPPLASGCQDGATRRWILDSFSGSKIDNKNECEVKEGYVGDLKDGEIIMVVNALRGIRLGIVKL